MLVGIFVNASDIEDIRRGLGQLRQWEAALEGSAARRKALREVLGLEASRLVRLAYEHFRTGRFSLQELAGRSGEDLVVLQGLTGSLGLACNRRGVSVFALHGGKPQVMSVREEVAEILATEAIASADE
jgi:hypothetical protein